MEERSDFVDKKECKSEEDGDIDGIAGKHSLYGLENRNECESEVLCQVGGGVNCYRSQQLHSNNTSNTYECPPPSR